MRIDIYNSYFTKIRTFPRIILDTLLLYKKIKKKKKKKVTDGAKRHNYIIYGFESHFLNIRK
jgi:hypothetical protein